MQLRLIVLFLLFKLSVISQTIPQKMNYQAVARNSSGSVISNQGLSIKSEILGNDQNTVLYSESHSVVTNQLGLFSVQIGSGTPVSGIFSNIDWSSGNKYIRTSIDLTGGNNFQIIGTSQLLSVPFSFYSEKAGQLSTGTSGSSGISEYVFPNLNTYQWGDALSFCSTFTYGGKSDWRLPTNNEIIQLLMTKGSGIFPTGTSKSYWTSSIFTINNAGDNINTYAYVLNTNVVGPNNSPIAPYLSAVNIFYYFSYGSPIYPAMANLILVR